MPAELTRSKCPVLLLSFPKTDNTSENKTYFPLSCMQLFNYLHMHGFETTILDFSHEIDDFETLDVETILFNRLIVEITDKNPVLLCFNCFTTGQFPLINAIAEKTKQLFPTKIICLGGAHPSLFAEEILSRCKWFDYIAIGEGEEQLLSLTKIYTGEQRIDRNNIQALAYRDDAGRVIINERKNFLASIDIPQLPAWEHISLSKYKLNTHSWNNPKNLQFENAIPIMTTRSCPFSCSFCSVSSILGKKLRCRNPKDIVDEIEFMHKEMGQNYFEFIDDNINVNKGHAIEIFNGIITRKLNIHFSIGNGIHLNSADLALVDIMAEAGLAMLKFPIEHGNEYIRNKIIGKKLSNSKIFEIVNRVHQYKIFTFSLFIIGFPEDTIQSLEDTRSMMQELNCDINFAAVLIPFPGTKVFNQCVADNLFIETIEPSSFYKGEMLLDSSDNRIYIKPYNISLETLLYYKNIFKELKYNEKNDRARGV